MKVAVTGATGFVGRHVISALLKCDVQVVAVAREPERAFVPNDKLTLLPMEMSDTRNPLARMGNPDVLLHLAWGGLPHYQSESHLHEQLPMQIAFLDACAQGGLRHLVVTGTCLEYGMQSGCLEEGKAAAPVTSYGEAKTRLHRHLQTLADTGGPGLSWLRLFYLYGAGQASSSLYSQLHAAVMSGAREFSMSPGDQIRDFLPIEVAASIITKVATNPSDIGTMNVCSGLPQSVCNLVQECLGNWGVEMMLNRGVYAYPDYEPHAYWGSTLQLDAFLRSTGHA